jgi:hypothetical protein
MKVKLLFLVTSVTPSVCRQYCRICIVMAIGWMADAGDFSHLRSILSGSVPHPTSYAVDTGGKAALA